MISMLTPFSKFNKPNRKYVCLNLSDKSCEDLSSWCIMNGFDISKNYDGEDIDNFDFHITLFYSENEVIMGNEFQPIDPVRLEPEGFDLFGEQKNIPVMKIKSTFDLRKHYKTFEDLGLESKFPVWKPHISLSYNYNGEVNFESLQLPKFEIYADTLKIEDIK